MSLYPTLPPTSSSYDFTSRISAEGAFGELWKVRVKSTNPWEANGGQQTEYACKMIKQLPPLTLHDIYTELNSIRRTCTSGHPNIVQVHSDWIEAGRDGIPTAHVVMELCTMNYAEYLKNLKINSPGYWWFGRPEGVDMRLELEILRGLAYIHSLNEIHRDLKPQNILLQRTMHPPYVQCKITDFGFTVPGVSNQPYVSMRRRSTEAYCSPELLFKCIYSSKSDIWAMGCILFESCFATVDQRRAFSDICSLAQYYSDVRFPPPQIGWVAFGLNPNDMPIQYRPRKDCVESIWAGLNIIFAAVFRRNPDERPDADTLLNNLVFVLEGKPLTIPDYRPCN